MFFEKRGWNKTALSVSVAIALAGCGGGGSEDVEGQQVSASMSQVSNALGKPAPSASTSAVIRPVVRPQPAILGRPLVSVTLVGAAASKSSMGVATFGQVFKQGEVPAGASVVARWEGASLPTQVDWKASHADGSLRHAVISVRAPLSAGEKKTLDLTGLSRPEAGTPMSVKKALDTGLSASVKAVIDGVPYTASLEEALLAGQGKPWLSGSVATEWQVKAPFKNAAGVEHPHLTARFSARMYHVQNGARVSATIENNWAYEAAPRGMTYDVEFVAGGKVVYAKSGLSHFRQARWRKVAWIGDSHAEVKHDGKYLMATRAISNYDPSLRVSEATLSALASQLDKANNEPMGNSLVTAYMPGTGGRGDIGPLPRWTSLYVVSHDERAKRATLTVGDLAGSWPIHYRDKKTDLPMSVTDWPYATLLGNPGDTRNPKTQMREAFPACVADCATSFSPDTAHQPSLAFVPYLVTGDYFYLEELQFWATYNAFRSNPYYREFEKGLLKSDQVRGQAWGLRTLAHAAYITPDDHPLKGYFNGMMSSNLQFYNSKYTNGNVNALGILSGENNAGFGAMLYATAAGPQTGVGPWQDDFFTWATGYALELGFKEALPIYTFKSKFPIGRMTDPEYCWIDGATYALAVRKTSTSPIFATFGEAWRETVGQMVNSTGARYVDQPCGSQAQADWRTRLDRDNKTARNAWAAGEMTGYASSIEGYPANMQPGLAVAANSSVPGAKEAWARFDQRSIKPNYATAPQWAIVPRQD